MSFTTVVRLFDIVAMLAILARFGLFLLHYHQRKDYALQRFPSRLWDDSWMMWKGIFSVVTLIMGVMGYSVWAGFPPNPFTVMLLPALVYFGVGIHRFANSYEEYVFGQET